MFVLAAGHRLRRRLPGLPGRGPARQGRPRRSTPPPRRPYDGSRPAPGRLPARCSTGSRSTSGSSRRPSRPTSCCAAYTGGAGDRRPGAGGAVLPVRPLPADRLSRPGSQPANLQGSGTTDHAAVERQLPRQHQPADELLARRGHQPRRDRRAAVRLHRRPASRPARDDRPADATARAAGSSTTRPTCGASPACTTGPRRSGSPRRRRGWRSTSGSTTCSAATREFLRERAYPVHEGARPSSGSTPCDRPARRQARGHPELLARARADSPPARRCRSRSSGDLFTNTLEAATSSTATRAFAGRARRRAGQARPRPADRLAGASSRSGRRTSTTRSNDHRHVSHLFALHPGRQITRRHPGARRGGQGLARRARRRRHRLEQGVEDQLLGPPARRRPRAQDAQRAAAQSATLAEPLRHPPAVPDRRQLRRHRRHRRDAAAEPARRDRPAARAAVGLAQRLGHRPARPGRRDRGRLVEGRQRRQGHRARREVRPPQGPRRHDQWPLPRRGRERQDDQPAPRR